MPNSDQNTQFTYITGGTMPPNAPSYVERKADYDLLAALIEGEYCHLLDTRQMGKSSLMVRTGVRLREHNVDTVILDLSAIGQNVTADRWYAGMLARLGEQFNIESELLANWHARPELGGLQRFIEGIRLILARIGRPLVIFVDEIDAVRSLPFSTDELFIAIRECYNRRSTDELFARLTFCLIGVAAPTDLIADTRLSPFNVGRRIVLEDFNPEEAALFEQGLTGGELILDRIIYWTGGHPYLTQRLCRAVSEALSILTPNTEHPTPLLVDRACADLFLTHRARESDDNLAFVRNRLLTSEVDQAALLELYGRIYSGKRVIDTETSPLCSVVKLSGIVRVENGLLRVRNRIYEKVFDRSWIAAHRPGAEVRRQRRAFRKGAAMVGAAAGLIITLIGGLAVLAVRNGARANFLARDAAVQRNTAETERDVAQNLEYVADMNLIPQNYEQGDTGSILSLLDQTRSSKYRGFEWGYWDRLCHLDLFTLSGNGKGATAPVYSPDGTRIATGCYDGTVRIWDAATGAAIRSLGTPVRTALLRPWDLSCIRSLAFTPDGKRVVAVSFDSTLKIWNAADGSPLVTLRLTHKGPIRFVRAVAISADCSRICAAGSDGTAQIWNVATGREICTVGTAAPPNPQRLPTTCISSVTFSPKVERIAAGRVDGTIEVSDAATGANILVLRDHTKLGFAEAYSPDGRKIVTGGYDGAAKVWDAVTGRNTLTLKGRFGRVTAAAFSPDGMRIVTACADEGVKAGWATVWDAFSGLELFTLKGHTDELSAVGFSPNGSQIVTASYDGTAKVWDASRDHKAVRVAANLNFRSVAFSQDDKQIITSNQDDLAHTANVKVWNAATGRTTITLNQRGGSRIATALSPDGKWIVTASYDGGHLKIWDAATSRESVSVKAYIEPVSSVAFSPDSMRLATGGQDGKTTIRDAASGKEVLALKGGSNGPIISVAFSPDGARIATGSLDNTAKVWNARTGDLIFTFKVHTLGVTSVAFSPDGIRLFTASYDGTVRVWNASSGRELLTLKGNSPISSAALSPDGKRIVTGSMDGLVTLWDAETGRETLTLNGHCGRINSVAFSHDGKRVVAGGNDKKMLIWSAEPSKFPDGASR